MSAYVDDDVGMGTLEPVLMFVPFCAWSPCCPSILIVLFFLFRSWVISLAMVYIISWILFHYVGDVSFMGSNFL